MNEQTNHAALIDRLAAGELDDATRRDLFTWLDGEPSRWRRCALVLLEARELEDALGAWQAETPRPAAQLTRTQALPLCRPNTLFALAATVLVAFSLGIFAREFFAAREPIVVDSAHPAERETAQGKAKEDPANALASGQAGAGQHPTAVASAPTSAGQPDLVPPYIRSQLERRGYHLTSRSAQLPIMLPDGRRAMVPVDELQLNYVGQRTY